MRRACGPRQIPRVSASDGMPSLAQQNSQGANMQDINKTRSECPKRANTNPPLQRQQISPCAKQNRRSRTPLPSKVLARLERTGLSSNRLSRSRCGVTRRRCGSASGPPSQPRQLKPSHRSATTPAEAGIHDQTLQPHHPSRTRAQHHWQR